jgi:hypothetical protein
MTALPFMRETAGCSLRSNVPGRDRFKTGKQVDMPENDDSEQARLVTIARTRH